MSKIKNFFIKLMPSKRKLIQLYAALLYNANMQGFIKGRIYTGKTKKVCLPGMNCYSCPGAVGACPLGSLQNALSESKTKAPFYVIGILLLYCILLGRTICGFLCPAGFLQELLYKIKTPKLKKSKVTRILSYFKYVLLAILVIAIPLIYGLQKNSIAIPGFCKYICPVGTFEGAGFLLANPANADYFGMLGGLFTWKFILLIITIVASIFIFRFFCRFFCPLGALYGLFNKLSILGIKVDKSKCNHCGACVKHCKMDVKVVGDHECINCGECADVCHSNAISWKAIDAIIKKEKQEESIEVVAESTEPKEMNGIENNIKPKKKLNKRFIYGAITTVIAIGFLIFAYVYYNVDTSKKIYKLNDTCEEINFKLYDNETYELVKDDKITIFYFYKDFDEKNFDKLMDYTKDGLDVVAISTYDNREINKEMANELHSDIVLGYDSVNATAISKFIETPSYPFSVFLNADNKIIKTLKDNETLSLEEYDDIIHPEIEIGNKVGNRCINQEISIIGTDETISVVKNRREGKITIINFWGTWCGPCVKELPSFNTIYEEFKDNVSVIAIHQGSTYDESVDKYIQRNWSNYGITFAYDDVNSPYYDKLGGKEAWPMTVIVDQNGIVTLVCQGSITEDTLRAEVLKLL